MNPEQPESPKSSSELLPGSSIHIGEASFVVEKVADANELASAYGLTVPRRVPVYYLDGISGLREGAYHPNLDCILIFKNTPEATLKHEVIHAIEYPQEKSPGLVSLYENAKVTISEDSFTNGAVSFNFRKSISEFIADGCSKEVFIEALKKENLYEDFITETAYLFA